MMAPSAIQSATSRAQMAFDYDFIVTGAGAAGRSFVYQLLQQPAWQNTRILLLDRERKNSDDRTWSFWEDIPGPFEDIVHHQWHQWWFYQGDYERRISMAPFSYKMVRSSDYYRFTDAFFAQFPNVDYQQAEVQDWQQRDGHMLVKTNNGEYTAPWCINSIWRGQIDKAKVNYLDQHFRGWFIETKTPVFDIDVAIPMDFRTPQKGEFRFLYVLPDSPTTALVEVAIFSNTHQTAEGYDNIIRNYLAEHWPQTQGYTIRETEQGNIPMTNYQFATHTGRVVHVGTAGGDTRASSGYTFPYIHRRIGRLIEQLNTTGSPVTRDTWAIQRHRYYDQLMLHVLQHSSYSGDKLFKELFAKNNPQALFRFLNSESSILEELRIMASAPTGVFLRALGKELVRR